MSTPLSKRNNLDGLALYAPRRARGQTAYEAPADPPAPEDESVDDRIPIAAEPDGGGDPGGNPETELDEQRIEEAIRKIVALGHPNDEPAMRSADHGHPTLAPHGDEEDHEQATASFTPRHEAEDGAPRIRRRSRLDAEIVPEPPVAERRSIFPLLIRLSSALMFAAVVAYGMTMFASMQSSAPRERPADYQLAAAPPNAQQAPREPQSPPHLIVEDQQAFTNEPLSVIVMVQHPQKNAALLFDGLTQGTKLSAGVPVSPSSWQVPYNQTQGLYLYAPKDFTGVMNTAVSLLGADKRLLDTQAVQLKWIARAAKPIPAPAAAAPQPKPAVVATAGDPTSAGPLNNVTIKPMASDNAGARKTMPTRSIDPAEAAMLMQRGRDFMDAGDISAARVAFNRLADAGAADAALALANTYDPAYLTAHHVMGVQGDRATARTWYERAKELGSSEAGQMLARMTGK